MPHLNSLFVFLSHRAGARAILCVLIAAAFIFAFARSASAQNWERGQWGAPPDFRGLNDSVLAMTFDKAGNLYVGGYFTDAGGDPNADRVAMWDGKKWNALGGGFNKSVQALAADSQGNVYAGGLFTATSDGQARFGHIAKWDGRAWTPLAQGLDNTVLTLAVDAQNRVYAGGDFKNACRDSACATSIPAPHIVRWNQNQWETLGSGLDNSVNTIAVDNLGKVFVGGDFKHTAYGTTELSHVAAWDGSAWQDVGGGVSGSIWPTVHAVAVDGIGNLYVAGRFALAGKLFAGRIAKWDGQEWSTLDTGMNFGTYSLQTDAHGDLYAGGFFTQAGKTDASHIAKWDTRANTWLSLGGGLDNTVFILTLSPQQTLFAGGDFLDADGNPNADRVAEWIVLKTARNAP
jgi:hypothetical protein